MRGAELVTDAAVGEQPGVGGRAVGEPLQDDGHERALDLRTPRQPRRQRLQVAQRAARVGVTERGETIARALVRQLRLIVVETRDGRQQRPVEQLLVQAAHRARELLPVGGDGLVGVAHQPDAASEAAQVCARRRHEVGATHLAQLDAVLEHAQLTVGAVERRGIRAPDVTPRTERLEGVERRAGAHPLVGASVDELQQLHGELDVAQTARAELDLACLLADGHVRLDATAHRLRVLHEVLALAGLPHHRPHRGDVGLADLTVARDGARLEERLELPALRPALVVVAVARDGAHEGALLALRAQRGVDLPQRTLPRARRASAHQLGRELRSEAQGDVLVDPVRGLRDEDDVDVGDVVELAPARLAHADDGESSLLGALDALRRDVQPRLERGTREVGE